MSDTVHRDASVGRVGKRPVCRGDDVLRRGSAHSGTASNTTFTLHRAIWNPAESPRDQPAIPPSSQILQEVEICEVLKKHPHPNVDTYMGCVVSADRIKGLCFARYRMTLAERLNVATPFDKDLCLQGIEQGIRHLHSLGPVHSDINPRDIMVDEMDRAILIDFDSCQREGDKIGLKAGTHGWSMEKPEYARFENDFLGLSKVLKDMTCQTMFRVITVG